jgi:hypothetical protein
MDDRMRAWLRDCPSPAEFAAAVAKTVWISQMRDLPRPLVDGELWDDEGPIGTVEDYDPGLHAARRIALFDCEHRAHCGAVDPDCTVRNRTPCTPRPPPTRLRSAIATLLRTTHVRRRTRMAVPPQTEALCRP